MALQKNISLKDNFDITVDFKDAYIKVTSLEGDKESMVATVDTSDKSGGQVLERKAYEFAPQLDGGNIIAQAYEHLKTLPEFSDATDC